jgi:YVTN family beta-propeller protein
MDSDCSPDRHLTSSNKRAKNLRLLLCVLALGTLLVSSASPQYLESTVLLPDTLGPLNGPYHLAWDENPAHPRLYIGGEGDSGGVIVAHALTCKRMARISTGPVKALCFVRPHGKLYVASAGSDSVTVVDCATNRVVSTITIGSEAPALQYNHLNDHLYCGGSSISVVDFASDTVVKTIYAAAEVLALDSTDSKLYACSDGPLSVIDCSQDSIVATIPRVDSVGAICYNLTAGKVYATSGDTLYAVRTQDDSIVAALHFGGLVQMLACNPATNHIYFVDGVSSRYLRSVDCTTDTAVLRLDFNLTPYSLACNAARNLLYFGSYCEVGVLDGTSGQVQKWITTQGNTDCGWSPGLDRLFCPPVWRETEPPAKLCLLSAIDGSGDTVAGFLPLTMYASGVSLDTVHNRLYFVYPSLRLGCIGVVDCSRNVVVSYKLVPGAEAVCYNPHNNRLYYGVYDISGDTSAIVVYDCAAESIVGRIREDRFVHAFRLHVGLNKLYAETWDPGLCIIDCNRDTLLAYIPWPDNYPRIQFLVPEDDRYWYLGPGGVIVVDCVGDTIVANVQDHIGSIDDACACREDRKIYTGSGQVINMDKPAEVDTLEYLANRFCYVPDAHKLYACRNDEYHTTFVVLDTRGDTEVATFDSPCQVSGMILDHTGEYVYCAGYEDSLVPVIDTRKDSVIARIRVSTWAAPRDPLALNRNTKRIYEAQINQFNGSSIPVIRDSMLVGLEEMAQSHPASQVGSTVVRRGTPMIVPAGRDLWDASGRRSAVLRSGPNDISRLAPGVYFVREARAQAQAVRKVVVTR